MSMLDFDRFLFAFTITPRIILVSASISLILLNTVPEFMYLRTKEARYSVFPSGLKKVFVIPFRVGTASGILMG